jgi:predicted methyltransferase
MMLPEKADLFWTTENYHDFHNGPTANIAALDKAVFNNLKPGGIFYVEDHSAATGAGLAATTQFHRMDEDVAKAELTAAGFRLDGEGNLLRNPADNKAASNSETGHFDSDRFMLRMKRP